MLLWNWSLFLPLLAVEACSYDPYIFGPFPEAVVPIQHDENGRLLVKFNVFSTLGNRTVMYAVVEFNETNQNGDVINGIVTNAIEYTDRTDGQYEFWQGPDRIHDDFLTQNHPELDLELTPDPEILRLTKAIFEFDEGWEDTAYDGTLVRIHSDDDGNDDNETMQFLLYKLVVVDWPQVRIDIYRLVHGSRDGNGIFEDDGRIDFEDDGVVLLASTTIMLEKPAATQSPDCSYNCQNNNGEWEMGACSWYEGDDPVPLLRDDRQQLQPNELVHGVFYHYSPKMDRFYVYYVWPLIPNIPDYCNNYLPYPDELFMVSIYQFTESVPTPGSTSLFDSSSETAPTVPTTIEIQSVQTVTLSNIESWPDYFRWNLRGGPRYDLRIYDEAQILRFFGPSSCENWYNVYYDTDTVEVIVNEQAIFGPSNIQRSIDLERKTYYRPKFDFYRDEKSLCFEDDGYYDWQCSVLVPWNITIEECYLTDPNTCIRTIRLNEKELFGKLVPLRAWPNITTDTTTTITCQCQDTSDIVIDWINIRDGSSLSSSSSSSNAATKALAAVAISVVLLSASIVTMWVKLRPRLQK